MIMRITTILCLFLSLSFAVSAKQDPIQLAESDCIDGVSGDVCHHFFEKSSIILPVDHNSSGIIPPVIEYELLQISHRLSLPLINRKLLCSGNCNKESSNIIDLPAFSYETEIHINLYMRDINDQWVNYLTFPIIIYPRTLLDSTKSWAEKNTFVLLDKTKILNDFFDSNNIRYIKRVLRLDMSKEQERVILTTNERLVKDYPFINTVLFLERVNTLPNITIQQNENIRHILVEMRLLQRLKNNPLAQKLFVKLFSFIQNENEERKL